MPTKSTKPSQVCSTPTSLESNRTNVVLEQTINFPVFTCSAKDYFLLKGTFSSSRLHRLSSNNTSFPHAGRHTASKAILLSLPDTEIPSLRSFCTQTSLNARNKEITQFFEKVNKFYEDVVTYMKDVESVNEEDCRALRGLWETKSGSG